MFCVFNPHSRSMLAIRTLHSFLGLTPLEAPLICTGCCDVVFTSTSSLNLPGLQMNVLRSSLQSFLLYLVSGTSSTTVLTVNSKMQPVLRSSSLEKQRSRLQSVSQRLALNVTLYLLLGSLTNSTTSWFGPRSVLDSVEIFASVCPVLLHFPPTLQHSSNKLDSVAMKDTVLPKLHHLSLPMDGQDQELPNYAALAELLTVSKLPSTPMLGMEKTRKKAKLLFTVQTLCKVIGTMKRLPRKSSLNLAYSEQEIWVSCLQTVSFPSLDE